MNGYSRRDFILAGAAAAAAVLSPSAALAGGVGQPGQDAAATGSSDFGTENQCGDPHGDSESLSFDPLKVQQWVLGQTKAAFEPRIEKFPDSLLAASADYLNMTRSANEDDISRMLALFDLPFKWENGKSVPFCAAGVSYVAAMVYARQAGARSFSSAVLRNHLGDIDRHHFYPSPSVQDMLYVAMGKRRWLSRATALKHDTRPKPGWLVIFDWDADGVPDHVGLVEDAIADKLKTIEFNTAATIAGNQVNGGAIARRERDYDRRILGFVRTEIVRPV